MTTFHGKFVTLQPKGCETAPARQLMHASLLSLNRSFGSGISHKYVFIMARPIKETPILYGEEARKFETRMLNPEPVSREWMESMKRDYEFMSSRCVNCTF